MWETVLVEVLGGGNEAVSVVVVVIAHLDLDTVEVGVAEGASVDVGVCGV